ncbi:MAG: hypothetical protein EOO73_24515 [Myxococcales bacterium]|nr:MAG: hypothetical protein EOO73_24515 [Myxococcales bacterium]
MLHRIAFVASSLVVSSLSFSAAAQTPPEPDPGMPKVPANSPSGVFGGKGQLAILAEAGVVFSHTSISGTDASSTTLVLRPAVDYFVIDHLSVGAFTGVSYEKAQGASTTTYAIGPRVGYDIPFTSRFSLWPKAGLSFNSTTLKTDTPSFSDTNSAVALNLFVPVMYHTNHYFVGFGPALDRDLSGDLKATTFALRLNVGGWLF